MKTARTLACRLGLFLLLVGRVTPQYPSGKHRATAKEAWAVARLFYPLPGKGER